MLFYADYGLNVIGYVSIQSRKSTVVITQPEPLAVHLHLDERFVFWSACGSHPVISKIGYDGDRKAQLVSTKISYPSALQIDQTQDKLYWCDGWRDVVESISLDGSDRKVIHKFTNGHYYDMSLHGGSLYLVTSLFYHKNIHVISQNGGTLGNVTTAAYTGIARIFVFSQLDLEASGGCPAKTYGPLCEPCHHCLAESVCEKVTGYCMSGCKTGYAGRKCNEECPPGTFGRECTRTCGGCNSTSVCNHVSGRCEVGCREGFRGFRCRQVCEDRTFGPPCRRCGQCAWSAWGQYCDPGSGVCPNGCQRGYTAEKCNEECANGTYDYSCSSICDECLEEQCDHVDGRCLIGCKVGMITDECKEATKHSDIVDKMETSFISFASISASFLIPSLLGLGVCVMRHIHAVRLIEEEEDPK